MGPVHGLLVGLVARNLILLPQNKNCIYFHFSISHHGPDAVLMLSQLHHVPMQGVCFTILGELAVTETYFLSHCFVSFPL